MRLPYRRRDLRGLCVRRPCRRSCRHLEIEVDILAKELPFYVLLKDVASVERYLEFETADIEFQDTSAERSGLALGF